MRTGLSLLLVNREPSLERTLSFRCKGSYTLVKEAILTAATLDSWNSETEKPIVDTDPRIAHSRFASYRMPEKSIAC